MVENGIDGMCVIVGDVCLLAGLFTIMYVCYYLVRFVVFHLCPLSQQNALLRKKRK